MTDQDKLLQTGRDASMPAAVDLGPLAWVVDSLRDTLHDVHEQLEAFSQEVAAASGSHLTTLDTTALRMSAQSLHEAVGVLDLVERPAAAKVVGAMERCAQLFVTNPELCVPDAAQSVIQAGRSVLDYLSSLLKGQQDHAPGLFPAYRAIAQLANIDRIHPADLWHAPWQWQEVKDAAPAAAPDDNATLPFMDGVLQLFRSGGANGADQLAARTQQLWQNSSTPKERVFWQLVSGFLHMQSVQALRFDDQLKRLLSRLTVQHDLLQQPSGEVSERLAQDLLYFIALGYSKKTAASSQLVQAIARHYQLDAIPISDYDQLLYGTIDPAQRSQLRDAITTFKDLWSDVSSGNTHKIQALSSLANNLPDKLNALWPAATPFSSALQTVIAHIAQTEQPPHPEVAMEVATAILFLEASLEETTSDCSTFDERIALLAQRLEAVQRSEQMEPPTEWMEALYARLHDQNSMAQVVSEARIAIDEVEQALDDFFRHPQKTQQAVESITKLNDIAGVLLALNFDEASRAIAVMSQQVQQLVDASQQTDSIDAPEQQQLVLKLGNSLGALSFMLDMMAYQPEVAKAQFLFNEAAQELTHRNVAIHTAAQTAESAESVSTPATTSMQLGQTHIPALDTLISSQAAGTLSPATATEQLGGVIQQAELAGQPALAQQARQALASIQAADDKSPDALAQAVSALAPSTIIASSLPEDGIIDTPIEEEDLRDIFLEEASEVIGNALTAIEALHANMADAAQLTNLRRAFHTLKGSGRMVGLASFGEAAWEMERMFNGWLADGKPATQPLLQLATDALEALAEWRESIARQEKTRWHHAYFSQPAAAMQENGTFVPIAIPGVAAFAAPPADHVLADSPIADSALVDDMPAVAEAPITTPEVEHASTLDQATENDDAVALFDGEHALFADEQPAVFLESASPGAQDEQDVFAIVAPNAGAAEEPSPFAEEAEHATAWSPSTFMASLPSLDLSTPETTDTTAQPADTAPSAKEDALFAGEAAFLLDGDAVFAEEDAEKATVATEQIFADAPAQSIAAPAAAEQAIAPPATFAETDAGDTPPLATQTKAEADFSDIHNALTGMLVDTTPQLAILQDMVDGLPDEEIKHVGHMRIPLALFNTYLNEADVWSRQLVQELSEWVLHPNQPIPHDCSVLAHSLAGSSAAVGMSGLASVSRGIEHAIDRAGHRPVRADEADTLYRAAEAVRQELHQFAAGLHQPANMPLLCKLAAIVENIPLDALSEKTLSAAKQLQPEHFLHTEKKTAEQEADVVATHDVAAQDPDGEIAEPVESIESLGADDATIIDLDVTESTDQRSIIAPIHAEEKAAAPAQDSSTETETEAQAQTIEAADAALPVQAVPQHPVAIPVSATTHTSPAPSASPALAAYDATPDSIDTDLFELFSEEAQTLIPQLHAVIRQWIAHPNNAGARTEAQRLLHTFKGGARLAGAMQLGAMAHDMESAISDITDVPSTQTLEQLQGMLDTMDDYFANLRLDTLGAGSFFGATGFATTDFVDTKLPDPAEDAAPLLTNFTFDAQPVQATPDTAPPAASAAAASDAPAATEPKAPAPASAPVATPTPTPTSTPAADAAASPQPAATTSSNTTAPAEPAKPTATPAVTPTPPPVFTPSMAPAASMQPPVAAPIAQVRVRSNVLDRMLGSTGEVMISRARLETEMQQLRQAMTDMDGSLSRLRAQLRDMELQAETQMQSRMAQSAESAANFDPLEFDRFTRVQELTRMMAESVNDVASVQRNMIRTMQSTEDNLIAQARQARELQDDLLRSRMVEFDSLSERLYRVVRQAAKENGKQVALNIVGAHTAMDRNIIERIASPFEHLLRNAVVHGIEASEQRVQTGKEATGHIEINLQQAGNEVTITVRDDGKGLDVPRIREKAIASRLLTADAAISDEEAMQLIFKSGLSTKDDVTSLAGRGVGMDVVRSEVNALGGRIETKSQAQVGTEFTLVLPLTTAVTHVVEVQAGDLRFGVPSSLVESVRGASAKEIQQAYNSHAFVIDGESLPFYWAGAMLQSSRRSTATNAKRQSVLVLHSATQRIVMHVDAVLGNHEVVVKNIGPQLARMPGLSSITVLPNGTMLFIYNPVALAFYYNEPIRAFSSDLADPAVLEAEHRVVEASPKPLILVVDDSITVRRVTGRLLQREGYRIATAADGLAALRAIAEEKPDVVLSDIEMPQMDGFELLRNIRNNADLKDLPVIMITSRTASKHREHAEELGSNGFLGKPYSEEALLEQLRQHTRKPTKK